MCCSKPLFYLLFSFVLILLSPLILFRLLLKCVTGVLVRRDLKWIHDPHTASQLTHTSNTSKYTQNNILASFTFKGKLDYEKVLERLTTMVYFPVKPDNPNVLIFPEFQMTYELFCGYPFWKPEANFQMENHVTRKIFPEEAAITEIEEEFLRRPLDDTRSPWEVLIVEKPDQWTLFYKCNHTLADGYALFNALMKIADVSPSYNMNFAFGQTRSLFNRLLNTARLPFQMITDAYSIFENASKPHPWAIPLTKMSMDTRYFVLADHIRINDVKEISRRNDVTFTSVIMAAVCAGIRRHFEAEGSSVPESTLAITSFPLSKHSPRLTNAYTSAQVTLPISCPSPSQRLKSCDDSVRKAAVVANRTYNLFQYFFRLPNCLQLKSKPGYCIAVQAGNMGGPLEEVRVGGQPIMSMHYTLWNPRTDSVLITFLSYNGGLSFVASADPAVMPSREKLQELVNFIVEEFQILKDMARSNLNISLNTD